MCSIVIGVVCCMLKFPSCSFLIRCLGRFVLRSNQCFDGLSLIHCPVPRSNLGKADRDIQDPPTGCAPNSPCGSSAFTGPFYALPSAFHRATPTALYAPPP